MSAPDLNAILNRLLILHGRSLPMYLSYAHPVLARGEDAAGDVLRQIVADQQGLADRIGEMILECNGELVHGEFPMVYTGYHDVSFDFLLPKLIQQQIRDISIISRCSEALSQHPRAKALADEALGAAKAHLESLEELRRPALSVVS
ncbi:MAG: hypothetical protein KDA55_05095 [Planctomycetales bacterium]|nr:hypothetical protein [Planctomycetales bacterium]MCA9163181.1 hypothetical protein [Planctomycetales bacterium]MCA9205482.1 hypothetical protein [Planctomycetales bacterium]MCA9207708.1 hypothetical protein [Planctomycetales bacterium]